ncbi:MAG: hypothetical protein AAFS07_10795 [Pseudomonadota bacterium]
MMKRLIEITRNARARAELEAFHRAEMREAGVTDAALHAFLNGR